MLITNFCHLTLCLMVTILVRPHSTSEDDFEETTTLQHNTQHSTHTPKDKILFKTVEMLVFQRNKRTTSRRTHSIHQLTCVGGTAGCKLFTPDVVKCEKLDYNNEKSQYDWRCQAEISDRVVFNHVEVICEGYDYPEDDFILLGSCGLEFTLDYASPHDYHDNSYFRHMDEYEKEMHHERIRERTQAAPSKSSSGFIMFFQQLVNNLNNHVFIVSVFLVLAICSFFIMRFLAVTTSQSGRRHNSPRASSYGPLASAVLTTKKAC